MTIVDKVKNMVVRKPETSEAKPSPVKREPAELAVDNFLKEKGIVLTLEPLSKKIRTVTDGSIVIDKPVISAKYFDE